MALRIYLSQNENEKVGVVGNYYARVDNMPPIGIDELAELIKEHNVGFSKGSIVGILKDMVSIIRHEVLSGQPVKIDDLAIIKASVENRGGWADWRLHQGRAVEGRPPGPRPRESAYGTGCRWQSRHLVWRGRGRRLWHRHQYWHWR